MVRPLELGGTRALDGAGSTTAFQLPIKDLTTHAVILGMTGSGKTGLLTVLVEEVLRSKVPVVMIDLKGDLPNLFLTFPSLSADEFAPWVEPSKDPASLASSWSESLAEWNLSTEDIVEFRNTVALRLLTPGATSGEPLHILSFLENPSPLWATDPEGAREALSATVSLLLRLIGRDPDPTRSRDHVVLSVFAERRLSAGQTADVASLLQDIREPPVAELGAMSMDEYLPKRERQSLATALNTLLASPTFQAWRIGSALDIDSWMAPRADGRTPATIVSVAHLDEEERNLVLGIVLEQFLAWVRTQPGTAELRGLLVFDEVYGFLPPHPQNPPTKRPLVSLLKQARGFGVGIVVATQNPMDLDYRALSNAGLWFVGRLQTDADRERVVEAMAVGNAPFVADRLKVLAPRWFMLRAVQRPEELLLLNARTTLCWLRGPMTRNDLRRLKPAP